MSRYSYYIYIYIYIYFWQEVSTYFDLRAMKNFGLKVSGKFGLNFELCQVFIYKCFDQYLEEEESTHI